MAFQVLETSTPASRIGQTITDTLNQLAATKMQQMQNSPIQKLFQQIGLPADSARALANMDPKSRSLFLQNPEAIQSLIGGQQQQISPVDVLRILQPELAAQQTEQVPQFSSGTMNQLMSMQPGQSPAASLMGAQPGITGYKEQQVPKDLQNRTTEELKELLARLEGQSGPSDRANKIAQAFTSPAQRIQEERLNVEKQKLSQKQQEAINNHAIKYFSEVKKDSTPAQKIRYTVDNILNLLESGKAQTGLKGRFLPKELQNETTQVLRTSINDLVLAKAAAGTGGGKGVMSKARLALEQLSKPDIWQQPGAIRKNLENIINDPTLMKALAESQASEELKREWGGVYPRDYESRVSERSQEIIRNQKEESKLQRRNLESQLIQEANQRYNAKDHPGEVIDDAQTGISLISKNGKWEVYKG